MVKMKKGCNNKPRGGELIIAEQHKDISRGWIADKFQLKIIITTVKHFSIRVLGHTSHYVKKYKIKEKVIILMVAFCVQPLNH